MSAIYSCPKCGSGNVGREIIPLSKAKKDADGRPDSWDAPLGKVAGDHDACGDCGHKWSLLGEIVRESEEMGLYDLQKPNK